MVFTQKISRNINGDENQIIDRVHSRGTIYSSIIICYVIVAQMKVVEGSEDGVSNGNLVVFYGSLMVNLVLYVLAPCFLARKLKFLEVHSLSLKGFFAWCTGEDSEGPGLDLELVQAIYHGVLQLLNPEVAAFKFSMCFSFCHQNCRHC